MRLNNTQNNQVQRKIKNYHALQGTHVLKGPNEIGIKQFDNVIDQLSSKRNQ